VNNFKSDTCIAFKSVIYLFANIIFSLIVTIAGGYSVHLLTKQDKPQEIKSQGNSGTINHNYYNTYPYVPPVLSVANKINNSWLHRAK
jgi:hypothetical protein